MFTELLLTFAASHLLFSSPVTATNHSAFLEKAVEYLVDYTAAESGNILYSFNIKKRVSNIAEEQFQAKIGKCCRYNYVIV